MLQQLRIFPTLGDKEQVKALERQFDQYFCQNAEPAVAEAISVITNTHPDTAGSGPLPKGVRQLAATFLFTWIDARWRQAPTGPNGQHDPAARQVQVRIRDSICGAACGCLIDDKLTLRKFARCVARIARFEFPSLWGGGGPFAPLLQGIEAASFENGQQQAIVKESTPMRAQLLFVLHIVLKEVAPLAHGAKNQRCHGPVREAAQRSKATCGPLLGHLFGVLVDKTRTSRDLVDWLGDPQQQQQSQSQQQMFGVALLVREVKTLAKMMLRCGAVIDFDEGLVLTAVDAVGGHLMEMALEQQAEREGKKGVAAGNGPDGRKRFSFNGIERDDDADEDAVVLLDRFGKIVTVAAQRHWASFSVDGMRRVAAFLLNGMHQQLSETLFCRCANALSDLFPLAAEPDTSSPLSPAHNSSSAKFGGGGGAGSAGSSGIGGGTSPARRLRNAVCDVLSPDAVTQLLRQLITRFFRDAESELREQWNADPETYVLVKDDGHTSQETDEGEELDPYVCAELFFAQLAACQWPGIVDVIWSVLTDALNSNDASFIAGALHCVGLGHLSLGSPEQFQTFLLEKLVPALLGSGTSPLILRRVVWVIGMWCDNLVDGDIRRKIFETFGEMLSSSSNGSLHPVVVLTMFRALSHLIHSPNFAAEQIAGRPLEAVLSAVSAALPRAKASETVANLTGIIATAAGRTIVGVLGDGARAAVRAAAPFGTVCDSLERFLRVAAEQSDTDNHELTAAVILVQALAAGFKEGLLSGAEAERAVDLVLACADREQHFIHAWTEPEAWEALAVFMAAPGVPPAISQRIYRFALQNIERVFDGREHTVLIVAYAALFTPRTDTEQADRAAFPPEQLGAMAMRLVLESDEDTEALLLHNGLLLLEAITRRYPAEPWPLLVNNTGAFAEFGNIKMEYKAALLATAIALCLEKHPSETAHMIPPHICVKFIDKAVEAADMMPQDYMKLLLLNGLTALANQRVFANNNNGLDGEAVAGVRDALEALRGMIGGGDEVSREQMESDAAVHWRESPGAAAILVAERRL